MKHSRWEGSMQIWKEILQQNAEMQDVPKPCMKESETT